MPRNAKTIYKTHRWININSVRRGVTIHDRTIKFLLPVLVFLSGLASRTIQWEEMHLTWIKTGAMNLHRHVFDLLWESTFTTPYELWLWYPQFTCSTCRQIELSMRFTFKKKRDPLNLKIRYIFSWSNNLLNIIDQYNNTYVCIYDGLKQTKAITSEHKSFEHTKKNHLFSLEVWVVLIQSCRIIIRTLGWYGHSFCYYSWTSAGIITY